MKRISIWDRLEKSLRENPINIAKEMLFILGIIWTVVEVSSFFLVLKIDRREIGIPLFLLVLIFSLIIGMWRTLPPLEIEIKMENSPVRIAFGDLFECEGYKVIPVGQDIYETEVDSKSLQANLINKFTKEGPKSYKSLLEKAPLVRVQKKFRPGEISHEAPFPLGTTAQLFLNNEPYLLFALTKTEREGQRPPDNCSVTKLWGALEEFWKNVRQYYTEEAINVPLLGSGVAGIKLPPKQLVQLILLSIYRATREDGQITAPSNEIRLILYYPYFKDIDLAAIKSYWSG